MSHERLNNIAFISIKNNSLRKLNYEQIIYNFRQKKNARYTIFK